MSTCSCDIPTAMREQIDEIVMDDRLGFENASEFFRESLRKNIQYYLNARGR